jgi:hypothetical protein
VVQGSEFLENAENLVVDIGGNKLEGAPRRFNGDAPNYGTCGGAFWSLCNEK